MLIHTSLLTSTLVRKDSDVLVYSAACHVPFPILFKLDRSSGQCDMISMEWLLSPPPDDPNNMNKGSVLEILLKNLASRQARRPGFGVRLFVQACVLAGCDYAPNQLSGVGLVNAFKFVRDNAHRNDCVRFEKLLASLPRKARADLDLKEYAILLAKSEAVFYYHLIRNQKGQVIPLSTPRISDQENGDVHHFSDHSPFLNRFDGDWSFLGRLDDTVTEGAPPGACSYDDVPQVLEVIAAKPRDVVTKRLRPSITPPSQADPGRSTKRVAVEVHNPYKVAKKPKEDSRRPLDTLSPNKLHGQQKVKDNPFEKFASGSKAQSGPKESAMAKYLVKKDDVRFVKRQFPFASSATQHVKSKASTSRRRLFSLQRAFGNEMPLTVSAPYGAKHTASKIAGTSLKKSHYGDYDSSQCDELQPFDYERPHSAEKKTIGLLPSNEMPRVLRQASEESRNSEMESSVEEDSEEDARPPIISTVKKGDCGRSGNDLACPADPPNLALPIEARPQQPDAAFFDLTDSNSGHAADSHFRLSNNSAESRELSSRFDSEQSNHQESSTSVGQIDCARNEFGTEYTITTDRREIQVGDFPLPNLDIYRKESVDIPSSEYAVSADPNTQSKYFKQKDCSRRVTLDPSEQKEAGMSTSTFNRSKKGSGDSRICSVPFVGDSKIDTISPEAKEAFWNEDEIVESPELDDVQQTTSRFAQRATRIPISRTSSSSRVHRGGTLVSAFQRQQELATTQSSRPASSLTNNPFSRIGGKSSKKDSIRPRRLENFFKPAKQRSSLFSQLEINVREPDDDF